MQALLPRHQLPLLRQGELLMSFVDTLQTLALIGILIILSIYMLLPK